MSDKANNTPLLASAYANDTESIKLFLEKGADVKAQNVAGLNALMLAASHGNAEIVKALLTPLANCRDLLTRLVAVASERPSDESAPVPDRPTSP